MKRFFIAAVVLLLLVGCKSKALRELDKIEAEIPNAATKDLTELAWRVLNLWSKYDYNLNEKEEKRRQEVHQIIMKEIRCKYAEDRQKHMREVGYFDFKVEILGDDKDILIYSSSFCTKEEGRLIAANPNAAKLWERLGFQKVIFRNDHGRVYAWNYKFHYGSYWKRYDPKLQEWNLDLLFGD